MQLLTKESIKQLLQNRFRDDDITSLSSIPNPFELKDMHKATDRIVKAIHNKEKILLVSDYDVDGTTSRVIIEDFFEYIQADISSITPNRFTNGYGLSVPLIEGTDAKVIITVDNGITSYEASEYCRNNNIDLIITDHHIASKLPYAYAIVNPKQDDCTFPFPHICGAQIAWYLVAGLKNKLDIDFDMNSLLDILVLAIIADVMPLVSMNRVLVQKSLKCFSTSQRPAILAIKEALQKETITSEDIAFNIAPKINVAGRLEDANLAIEFLKSKDIFEARDTYEYLTELNLSRKQMQEDIFLKSCEIYENDNAQENVIVVASKDFHAGIIGIVASKLADKYKKIALVGSVDKDTNIVKMSGRSYGGVNLYDLLNMCSEHISSFGGHKEAVGLSIDLSYFDNFKDQMNEVFKNNFNFKDQSNIFGVLKIQDIDYELISILESFEPFGHKNERPMFCIKKLKVIKADLIGKDKKTLKLAIDSPNGVISAIEFNSDKDANNLENTIIDIYAGVGVNIFRGQSSIQLMINEIL